MGAVKISKGIYEYKGYRISNCGYYEPDHCIWWEAVDMKTGCADYHATTKKFLMEQIDDDYMLWQIGMGLYGMEMVTDLQLLRVKFNKKPPLLQAGVDVTIKREYETFSVK